MITYESLCKALILAIGKYKDMTGDENCVVFMTLPLYKKAQLLLRDAVVFDRTQKIAEIMGHPIEIVSGWTVCRFWIGSRGYLEDEDNG